VGHGSPMTDCTLSHPKRSRNGALLPALLLQLPGAQPSPLAPVLTNRSSFSHALRPCTLRAFRLSTANSFAPATATRTGSGSNCVQRVRQGEVVTRTEALSSARDDQGCQAVQLAWSGTHPVELSGLAGSPGHPQGGSTAAVAAGRWARCRASAVVR